ncbi:hypothetical cytosolic protein [Syntrophus aciditrophicus SB]|uniref:Hypothetical cytosolic protein n=1 Tax=Syntrophus aciditrophicus (strain SB) TaxID=56780 RepID=Q2LSH0_SYNAS|nr:hypothetical cytosolic protein [Syntrophus aciditrophicus SB]
MLFSEPLPFFPSVLKKLPFFHLYIRREDIAVINICTSAVPEIFRKGYQFYLVAFRIKVSQLWTVML